ncbi:DUF3088 domain-containing protein [Amylibacter sp. SFDW26]|uniref:DUF3088 family protein n=1 Tax=Amylibacter sp. SFDW26 TaxID=2652722 RepID=UPI00126169A7|nr:DUF3088 family protein [Amylibacter sp. SFDW26]KAB7615406.1 DUF3088 domain-containing protein [Amylibacter sp. SFDW26]
MILYLLKTSFTDEAYEGEQFFCPYCIHVEGVLSAFPVIRETIDVRYVDFAKPRGALPDFAGDTNQSCPQLILPNGDDAYSGKYSVDGENGTKRIDNTIAILDYLSDSFQLSRRHP